jgi:hypothetical protein
VVDLQAVEELHQRHPTKPGLLKNTLGEPRTSRGHTVMALESTDVLGNNGGRFRRVWKGLCYRRPETLGDAEKSVTMVAG